MRPKMIVFHCVHRYGIETTKFLGCIRNAKVASRGSYRQNLMASNHVGVKDGCSSKVKA